MADAVVIYIAPPTTERGRWRVRSDGNAEREVDSRAAAIDFAVGHARMIETAGGEAVIKIENQDGTWEVFRF